MSPGIIKSQGGFGLVQALMVVAVISGISYVVMDALNLNNRILQNVSSAKIIDDVVEDIYTRLKDPELCAVDYFVSREYDDKTSYARKFNRRFFVDDGISKSEFPEPVVTVDINDIESVTVEGKFIAMGNFFRVDTASLKTPVPFILNRRGVENFRWTEEVSYRLTKDSNLTDSVDGDSYNYDIDPLNYADATRTDPGDEPANEFVAYRALPEDTPLSSIIDGTIGSQYIIGGKVAIKEMFLTNYQVAGSFKTMDLVIIFIKNVNTVQRTRLEGESDEELAVRQRSQTLGGRLTRRVIKITLETFTAPSGTQFGADTSGVVQTTNTTIQSCYADKNNYIKKLTRHYCLQSGGSFENGECLAVDATILRAIKEELCNEMYKTTPSSLWDGNQCVFPSCKYGVTGFAPMNEGGRPKCLCNIVVGDNSKIIERNADGTMRGGPNNCPPY